MRIMLLLAGLLAVAAPVAAQDRSPALRQALLDLAYVLGESHALRQACQGEADQYWRARMIRLVEVEAPDTALEGRLRQSFNTGFATRRSGFPACSPASRQAEAAVAARGRVLAAGLAQALRGVPPADRDVPAEPIAEPQPPR